MGMDGLYRPSQALGYTDALGNTDGADRAVETAKKSNRINQQDSVEQIDKDSQERENNGRQRRYHKKKQILEEELEDLLFEQFNIELQPDVVYKFLYNDLVDRFELIDTFSDKVLLALTPEAFIEMTKNMRRNSGIIADQSA